MYIHFYFTITIKLAWQSCTCTLVATSDRKFRQVEHQFIDQRVYKAAFSVGFKFKYYFLCTSVRSESFMHYAIRKLHQLRMSLLCGTIKSKPQKLVSLNWLPQLKRSYLFIHFLCCSMQSWSLEIHDKWTCRASFDLTPWQARGFLFDITTCGYIVIIVIGDSSNAFVIFHF